MDFAPWLKLAHVIVAIVLITGFIGRSIVLARAERSTDVRLAADHAAAAAPFESMVRIASGLVLVFGLLTAWAQGYEWLGVTEGWIAASLALYVIAALLVPIVFIPRGRLFESALHDAVGSGQVTPALRTAFADPAVRAARTYELVSVFVIVALMVVKPF
jgi:uncharacterized membrane protein